MDKYLTAVLIAELIALLIYHIAKRGRIFLETSTSTNFAAKEPEDDDETPGPFENISNIPTISEDFVFLSNLQGKTSVSAEEKMRVRDLLSSSSLEIQDKAFELLRLDSSEIPFLMNSLKEKEKAFLNSITTQVQDFSDRTTTQTIERAETSDRSDHQKECKTRMVEFQYTSENPNSTFHEILRLLPRKSTQLDPTKIKLLEKAANSENHNIRGAALSVFGQISSSDQSDENEWKSFIHRGLIDDSEYVRCCAVEALFGREGEKSFNELENLLARENSDNVLTAVLTCFFHSQSPKASAILDKHSHRLSDNLKLFADRIRKSI